MKYRLPILLALMFAGGGVFAQFEDSVSTIIPEDYGAESSEASLPDVNPEALTSTQRYRSEEITVRKFDDKKLKEVIGGANFDEQQPKRKAESKDKKVDNQESKYRDDEAKAGGKRYHETDYGDTDDESETTIDLGGLSWLGPIGQMIFYGGIAFLIGFLIYTIVKNTSLKNNSKKVTTAESDVPSHVEDITDLDIDTLLQRTLATGNYRLVMRIYFLGLLKKLNEHGFIAWTKDKTNRDYLTELYLKQRYFEEVKRLTLAYEQVWYGDHALPADVYQQLIEEFKAIDQQLNASRAL
jgi:hypothetical protein